MAASNRYSRFMGAISILAILFLFSAIDTTPTFAASPIIVNTMDDTENVDRLCSLREAVEAARAGANYGGCIFDGRRIITLPAGIFTVNLGTLPHIDTDIAIIGVSPTDTIIQPSNCNPTTNPCLQDYELFYIGFEGTLTLKNLTIRHAQSFDMYGGAIYNNSGSLRIYNCTIRANKSKKGGAIGNYNYATLSIKDSTISGNTVYDVNLHMAGAIYNSVNSIAIIQSSTFSGNSAIVGGAIFNDGTLEITNSTFSGNIAMQDGGAIYNLKEISIINSTLFGNSATYQGAGIYNAYASLNFSNTIISNSTAGDDCHNGNLGTIGINHNNLVEDGSCSATYSGDPLLGSLTDNSGPTKTHALLTGSNAIDTGYTEACPATDQRGVDRPQGGGCDIGAFEKKYSLLFLPLITK